MPSLVGMNCLSQGKPTYSESILKPRLGDSVTLFSRIHTKALGFLSGLCLLGALCLQGCTEPPKASLMDRITLAPTAVTIPLERLHQDVLDARAPLDTFVCLKVKQRQMWRSKLGRYGVDRSDDVDGCHWKSPGHDQVRKAPKVLLHARVGIRWCTILPQD